MVDEFEEFFSNAQAGRASKLEPYGELIRQCRRRRWSFRRIASELKKQKHISVGAATIWDFLKAQSRPARAIRKPKPPMPAPAPELPIAPPPAPPPESAPATSAPRKPRFNLDI
jgi:hypothetical protein